MTYSHRFPRRLAALLIIAAGMLLPALIPPAGAQVPPAPLTVELEAIGDARIQGGSPDVNFPSGFLHLITLNGHLVFVQFDITALPANATITAAELQLTVAGVNTGPNDIEVGRPDGPWEETTLTWNNQPPITWGGPVTTANASGPISWDVTSLVQQWNSGARTNYGFALRGNGGQQVTTHSRETSTTSPPKLIVTYTTPPDEGARPDLGDAPDSTNSLGVSPNTAYVGVPGNFPTVWAGTPAGQPAGPRHANATGEGILGDYLSREVEADSGPDADGLNNILNGGADNADNDRGDDGWRNRNVRFFNCTSQTLTIRVRKAPGAQLKRMFLNVWFDGNRDGDWDDRAPCTPQGEQLNIPSSEWIVQDYVVDLANIPAGGFVDINVNTDTILNTTPGQRHWMRFTLSERRAPQFANGRADGRGPHPAGPVGSYSFGETEDVLQRPLPPGQDGTLTLEKRVTTGGEPVPSGGTVTYQVRLRNTGGTQPVQARIRDLISFPQHLVPRISPTSWGYIEVTSATGGAAPLQATLGVIPPQPGQPLQQAVEWQGVLAPDAEVTLTFDVHAHPYCGPNQQTDTIRNTAQARQQGGPIITDEVTFSAQCPDYDGGSIRIDAEPIDSPIDLDDLDQLPVRHFVQNNHPFPVTMVLIFDESGSISSTSLLSVSPSSQRITLAPGERRQVDFALDVASERVDELSLPDELNVAGRLRYCFVVDGPYSVAGPEGCPDATAFPNLHGVGPQIDIPIRPNDLGDAPDSTNHAGAAMAAYPGVPAAFPTVFDPATGLPPGPLHAHPRPLHLGQQVSREAEADIGPDQDPLNNIVPAANDPNNDRFDDGANPNQWALSHCQTTNVPVQVFVSPQAANWFAQQERVAFLNIWLDANRDGDWADGASCPPDQAAVEHIVIDFPVDVAALGAGLHIVNVPTGLVPWPAALAQQPSWVRVTLSGRESNKTLQFGGITYGDGRGYPTPFKLGETEDYLMHPEGAPGAGPDLAVQLDGRVTREAGQQPTENIRFKIDYANLGSRVASGAVLTFTKPQQLHDPEIVLLRAPGIPAQNITEAAGTVTIALPDLAPGQGGSVVIGWAIAPGSAAGDYEASVQATLGGDTDPSNNQWSATLEGLISSPLAAAVVGDGGAWGLAETTCRTTVDLAGMGQPSANVDLLLDGKPAGSATSGADGIFHAKLQGLADGEHEFRAIPAGGIISPRDPASGLPTGKIVVDTSLPVDPMSLTFTDSQGNVFHPPTLGWSWGITQEGLFLREGETYEVGIDSCVSDPNMQIRLSIIAILIGLLQDDDGDGRYTGTFTYAPPAQPAQAAGASPLVMEVFTGGVAQRIELAPSGAASGAVRDALSGQPVEGASVAALATSGSLWPDAALGQPNPQTTGADGAYSLHAPGGAGRLDVTKGGYQPYRTLALASQSGALSREIALTPDPGPATHTVYITAAGAQPALLRVPPGSVVEWVNLDLAEHTVSGAQLDSGALAPGQSYRFRFDAPGAHTYGDGASPLTQATIVVEGNLVFLPLVMQ